MESNKAYYKQDKARAVDSNWKATSTPLKPQIQGPKTKERKKSARTLPFNCREKREIKDFLRGILVILT